jgi:hypothetical protein
MWHEMSHVFILTATNHRVPRWFTEGLAVHEEGQANPEWANRLTPEVVEAIKARSCCRWRTWTGIYIPGVSGPGVSELLAGGDDLRLHQRALGE